MDLKFKITGYIARPVHEVFEAVAHPDQLSRYFTTGGAKGRLETGATVTVGLPRFPGRFPGRGRRGGSGPQDRAQVGGL